jgi:predicted outer membrane repeat protein
MSNDGSAFYIDSQGRIVSDNNDFNNCFDAKSGGVFYLSRVELIDKSSKFTNNSALEGGAIRCSACNLNLDSTQFRMNLAGTGGAL